jgi:tetratricopeptide (TPR) repeat protein
MSFFLFFVSSYIYAESFMELSEVIERVFESAKLKEEINLSGITLDEITGEHPELENLKGINLRTYQISAPPTHEEIKEVVETYKRELVDAGWQMIMRRTDQDMTVLIYGEERDWLRENLLIVLINPSEISEMSLTGEIELSALDNLRRVILDSMPKLDTAHKLADFFDAGTSPSKKVLETIKELEAKIETKDASISLDDYFSLATAYHQAGQYDKALKTYNFVLENPESHEWWQIQSYQKSAEISEHLGRYDDAIKYYDSLIKKFKERSDIVYSARESIKWLRNAKRSFPSYDRTRTPMEKAEDMLYARGEYEKAISLYQEIIDSDPDNPDAPSAMLRIAMIYGLMNQPEKKLETLKEAAELYPSAMTHKHLGVAYQNRGMYEKALEQYDTIIKHYPGSGEVTSAYINAGRMLEGLGQTAEAGNYYRELAERYKSSELPRVMAEKELIRMKRGDDLPFLGLGFRHGGSSKGVLIVTVFKNGPAFKSGVKTGDILLEIDSTHVGDPLQVVNIIGRRKNIGDTVTLLIKRNVEGGESSLKIPVTLVKTPHKLER